MPQYSGSPGTLAEIQRAVNVEFLRAALLPALRAAAAGGISEGLMTCPMKLRNHTTLKPAGAPLSNSVSAAVGTVASYTSVNDLSLLILMHQEISAFSMVSSNDVTSAQVVIANASGHQMGMFSYHEILLRQIPCHSIKSQSRYGKCNCQSLK